MTQLATFQKEQMQKEQTNGQKDPAILHREFEVEQTRSILRWAIERYFPKITLACSFGAEDVVLFEMVSRINKKVRVFYLDTQLLFKETYETRDRLIERCGMAPVAMKPELTVEQQTEKYGEALWERNPTQCCNMRKVGPLKRALEGQDAWITGIRRQQAPTRANTALVEDDAKFGLVKLNPLAHWRDEDVWDYIREHDVPYNPLHDKDYPSIGCNTSVCTRPVKPGEDPRSGRWAGFAKTECGLHK
jgi:phosphoadenosine phosphosulfate reductase